MSQRTPKDPFHPALSQENWRSPARLSGSAPTFNGERVSSSSPYDTNAKASSFRKPTMPKNFDRPLTCFYWHTYGYCIKSDEDCLYAHYDTAIVASPPVAMSDGQGAIAGRNATKQLKEHQKKQKELDDREAYLAAREMELNGRFALTQAPEVGENVLRGIFEVIEDTKAILNEIATMLDKRSEGTGEIGKESGGTAVELANLSERIKALEVQAESKLGRPVPLSEPVRIYLDVGQS